MSATKVNLSPIKELYLENLVDAEKVLGAKIFSEVFTGTDLSWDPKTGDLKTKSKQDASGKYNLLKEASELEILREADENNDGFLDPGETQRMFKKRFPAAIADRINPEAYLKELDNRIKVRYQPLAKNFQKLHGELLYKPGLDAIETYHEGVLKDDLRHAETVLPLNGLTKSAANFLSWAPYALYRGVQKGLRFLPKPGKTWYPADYFAVKAAHERHAERGKAIGELKKILATGIEKREPWALKKDFAEALKRLDAGSRKLIQNNIPAEKIFAAVNAEPKTGAKELLALAKRERSGFFGWGGGNSSGRASANFFNYFGWHRNTHFLRSTLAFLGNKADTGDKALNETIRKDAVSTRKELLGDGGSFTNLVAVGTSAGLCGSGYVLSLGNRVFKTCERTKFRSWGDEAYMDMAGRAANFGLTMYGGYKGFQFVKESWGLRRLEGIRGVTRVMKESAGLRPQWMGGKGFQPLPVAAMNDARKKAAAVFAESGVSREPGWLAGKWNTFKDKVFGAQDEKFRKMASSTTRHGGKFIAALTDYVILPLAVASPIDQAAQSKFNPFDTNHELELAPYPDISKKVPGLMKPKPKPIESAATPPKVPIRLRLPAKGSAIFPRMRLRRPTMAAENREPANSAKPNAARAKPKTAKGQ